MAARTGQRLGHGHGHDHGDAPHPAIRANATLAANQIPPHVRRRRESGDPTGTKTVRAQYERGVAKRLRKLKGVVRRLVAEDDWFGLGSGRRSGERPDVYAGLVAEHIASATNADFERPSPVPAPAIDPPAQPGYRFPTDADRVDQFERWLKRAGDGVLLGGQGPFDRDVWTDQYVRYSYGRGIMHADASLRHMGLDVGQADIVDTFNLPVHRETLGLFYQRQYDALQNVTEAMSRDVARTLTEGLNEGLGPRETARRINGRVDAIGLRRARLVARTETIWATNEAALNRYGQVMDDTADVTVVAEFTTAGDGRVCAECEALQGARFDLKDAHNVIPKHPACRCVWVPIQAM